jgi:DSF synthase
MRVSADGALKTAVKIRESKLVRPVALRSRPGKPLPSSLDLGAYREMNVALDPTQRALWCLMRPKGPQSFTAGLLSDLATAHRTIHRLHRERPPGAPNPVRFWVVGSDMPGVFNLGGDLGFFVKCIKAGDHEALRAYAHACVDATFSGAYGMKAPCITIVVVQGDALGGGFEAALSGHVLIAERGARMGLPEVMFNTFPGMGAYSFLTRKVGAVTAEKLILSGKVYLAEELHEMGIVDVLAPKGGGREAARQFMADNERRQPLLCALDQVRKRVVPLTKDELIDVTDIWVDSTMELESSDVRKMEILVKAQARRVVRDTTSRESAVEIAAL